MAIGALLAGSGIHLAILQSYAWVTMAARNMKSAPPAEALTKTFDGSSPCHLCHKIQKPLQAPSHNIAAPSAGPVDALFLAGDPLLATIMAFDLTLIAPHPVQQRAARVTTPPPRFLQV